MPISDLDTDQRHAATASGGEVAVSADAGSGKTRILVSRYLHLVKKEKLHLSEIAAITFTNKAANQMKEKITEKAYELAVKNPEDLKMWLHVAENAHFAPISTIHSFCNSILRNHPIDAGLDPFFKVIDEVTNSELKNKVINRYVISQMLEKPNNMAFLMDTFGMSELKKILRSLLDKRTHVVKFLDSIEHSCTIDTATLQEKYKKSLLKQTDTFIYMLKEFHTFRPESDRIVEIYDILFDGLEKISDMQKNDIVDTAYITFILDSIVVKGGSSNKWGKDRLKALRDEMKECKIFLNSLISFYENEKDVTAKAASLLVENYNLIESLFLETKKSGEYLDNDDILIETWKLLRTNGKLCQKISLSYRHILVDEFQDTDGIQMDILRMIAGNSPTMLFTVGDSKQSIFRFRGADVTVFDEFKQNAENFLRMKANYRSSPSIISFINATFSKIMGDEPEFPFEAVYTAMKPVRNEVSNSPAVELVVVDIKGSDLRRTNEANFIAKRIRELNTGDRKSKKYSFRDMALLLRKGTQVNDYEEAFLREGIPFVNKIGGRLSDSPVAYDIGNLLSWLCHPADPVVLTAVLISPFFNVDSDTLFKIKTSAGAAEKIPSFIIETKDFSSDDLNKLANTKKISEILKGLLSIFNRVSIRDVLNKAFEETGYTLSLLADRIIGEQSLAVIDLILETADTFEKNGGSPGEFANLLLSGERFTEESARVETKDDALSILTIHRAKGLEFKVVFLADITSRGRKVSGDIVFDDDLGPGFNIRDKHGGRIKTYVNRYTENIERKEKIAESKRLFYVGCTRAKDHLVISGGTPPRELDCKYEKDNWMRWLHASLSISPDGELSESTNDAFVYHRIHKNNAAGSTTVTDHWKKLLNSTEKDKTIEDYPLEKLIAPVKSVPVSDVPAHTSPTQIMDYTICPALYVYKHVHGLDIQSPVSFPQQNDNLGIHYGLLAHTVLEKLDFNDSNGWESLVETMAGSNMPAVLIKKLNNDLRRFSESDLFRQITKAEELRSEEPFAFIEHDVLVRGKIDLIYRNGNNPVIVDYKTEKIRVEEIHEVSESYRLQLGLYALAVSRALSLLPSRLVLYYLSAGVSFDFPCTQTILDNISATLKNVLKSMSEGNFSPVFSERCDLCPYKTLCEL
ncbi:UvrD-helicase domain-containing protein [Candidatus Latescibacterota bacterium]